MNLVDDVHLVFADLGRNTYLVNQAADVVHRVVAGSIQFADIERTLLVECYAGLTLVASIVVGIGRQAVDGLGEDSGASGLTYSTGAAEEVGVSEMVGADSIAESFR